MLWEYKFYSQFKTELRPLEEMGKLFESESAGLKAKLLTVKHFLVNIMHL